MLLHLLRQSASAVLDGLFRVRFGEDDDRIELGVVQLVHRVRGHVQQGVIAAVHDLSDGRQSHDAGGSARASVLGLSLRRRVFGGVILQQSVPGDISHGAEDNHGPVEARMTHRNAFVSREFGHALGPNQVLPMILK